ncbi:hypothetical protein sos41_42830 [Alphaproteobacteria bacterium SO-S41]|nr:hypothetical protein sos41_42830 [Alphaproteobacteria bacterium SO-S41]
MKRVCGAAALLLLAASLRPALAGPVIWPVPACGAEDVATASPAPLTNDSASLTELPFIVGLSSISAGLVIGLNEDNTALIRCVYVDDRSVGLEGAAILAVAGLKFATPRVPNTSIPGGRYLVRVATLFGLSWVEPPPRQPLLPPCPKAFDAETVAFGPNVPKPLYREKPVYPPRAEEEGIEGSVEVQLDVFASGAVSPACIAGATPPGWFEQAAIVALSQWRFNPPAATGPRRYQVTIKFRMAD